MKRVTRPADGVIKPKIMSETSEKPKYGKEHSSKNWSWPDNVHYEGFNFCRQLFQNKAHEELAKRLKVAVPELVVNCEDIYYCW
ncbi:hypothetical protein TELCIR_04132 [Teladorsagia circumcincta]|uniref:Uncharacterized protein n=1 Tax=Teladorsagia circumcincta TaxID=45464 RepID=A0A2G9UUN5_TELCI|nr:hypothetical protein TELCIR_04132 [Teladorsagia circumcincta]